MKNIYKILIISIILIALVISAIVLCIKFTKLQDLPVVNLDTMMMSTTKNTEKSDFDNWLLDELGVKYVPSYIVVDGHEIIGIIDGGFGVYDFKKQYNEIIQNHNVLVDFSTVENTKVYIPYKDKEINLTDILEENKINVIEVHKIACDDCRIVDGVPGEYTSYAEFDEDGVPIESSEYIIEIDGTKICETVQIHSIIKANFYRYYIKSNLEEILERYA